MADDARDRTNAPGGGRPANPLGGSPTSAGGSPGATGGSTGGSTSASGGSASGTGARPLERRDQPTGGNRSQRVAPSNGGSDRSHSASQSRTAIGPLLGALALGLILGAFGLSLLRSGDASAGESDPFAGAIDSDRYQAVILSNDKVYFGRIENVSDTFFKLDEAYFLREVRENETAEPQRSLLPINNELHAPENTMLIRKDEVVLVENLDEESPVLEEIRRQNSDESGDE